MMHNFLPAHHDR